VVTTRQHEANVISKLNIGNLPPRLQAQIEAQRPVGAFLHLPQVTAFGIDPATVSETARPMAEGVLAWAAANPEPLHERRETENILRVSASKRKKLEKAGVLEVIFDEEGRKGLNTTRSIVRKMLGDIIHTYPVGSPSPAREGPPRPKRKRQRRAPPSEAQLRGFREANLRRHREKLVREEPDPAL
jgi:hypothetical protein